MIIRRIKNLLKPQAKTYLELVAALPAGELIEHQQIVIEHNTLCRIIKKLNQLVNDPENITADYIKVLQPVAELIESELTVLNARDILLEHRTGLSALRNQSEAQ